MKLLLLVLCASVVYGLAPIQRAKVGRTVPDNWIIKIKDKADLDRIKAEILGLFNQRSIPNPRVTTVDVIFPALILKVPAHLLESVRSIEGIESIHDDVIGTTCGAQQNAPWGLDRIDNRNGGLDGFYDYNDNRQGAGVCVYVVDTGVRTSHSAFGGRASSIDGRQDDNGHGTHCAGTAAGDTYGIARGADIYSVKICTWDGKCSTGDLVTGLNNVAAHAPNHCWDTVLSMSVGFPANFVVDDAVQRMINAGYTVSAAAGNDNIDAAFASPARMADVITVGNVDNNDRRHPTSNFGNNLDLFAPGTFILSAGHNGDFATATLSGTSMACPHVTGAAAVYLGSNGGSSPSQVKTAIVNGATNNVVSDTMGSPNKLLYINPN